MITCIHVTHYRIAKFQVQVFLFSVNKIFSYILLEYYFLNFNFDKYYISYNFEWCCDY